MSDADSIMIETKRAPENLLVLIEYSVLQAKNLATGSRVGQDSPLLGIEELESILLSDPDLPRMTGP